MYLPFLAMVCLSYLLSHFLLVVLRVTLLGLSNTADVLIIHVQKFVSNNHLPCHIVVVEGRFITLQNA